MARLARNLFVGLLLLALAAAAAFYAREYVREHPQDVPWTELRLDDPIGRFTRRKLAALADEPAQCRALLAAAASDDRPAAPRSAGPDCGYVNGFRLVAANNEARFAPAGIVTSCPVAAALLVLERQVIQPSAERYFGSEVREITNAGSYSCRRIYGRAEGGYSEHATANAIDLTGFVLADGTVVSVQADWRSDGPEAAFLREVHDGACRLFATSLSPDYNAAHADHLHLDQARRGQTGFGVCR